MKQIWNDIKERWPLILLGAATAFVSLYLAF